MARCSSGHRTLTVALAAVLTVVLILPGHAGAQSPSAAKLRGVHSFAFALGSGDLDGAVTRRLAPFDLVVIDGEEATRAQVRALQSNGKVVLAYLSVGTIEPGRSWYGAAKPYRLRDRFEEFGEFYADSAKPGYRALIAARVAPAMLRKGFDGLFLDNTDMTETHPRQTHGMRLLVRRLSRLVHGSRHRLLFTQNGDHVIGPTIGLYDGWNREDVTSTYDFGRRRYVRVPSGDTAAAQRTMRKFRARGLLVTSADYVRAGDATATRAAVANACAVGALPFVSNIGLTRIPRAAFTCP